MTDAQRPHRWGRPTPPAQRGYGLAFQRMRRALMRAEPNCRECAKAGVETKATHCDHVVPKCLGGPDIASNLQPLCSRHALSKTGREGALIGNMKRRLKREARA